MNPRGNNVQQPQNNNNDEQGNYKDPAALLREERARAQRNAWILRHEAVHNAGNNPHNNPNAKKLNRRLFF